MSQYLIQRQIGPFFFENDEGVAVTVNDDHYRIMLNEVLVSISCHAAEATLDVLCPVFEVLIISRRADIVWPHLSCDLTAVEYYL